MRKAFVGALVEAAERDERIWLLTGDLGYSVLEPFAGRFPGRFLNMGVAEQNMIGVASGLSASGKVVFAYSIANFSTMRCLEQIRNDVCHHGLDVKIVAVGGGFTYGSAGYTHHGVEDIAVMRAMPGIAVVAPGDDHEAALAAGCAAATRGPFYLRLGGRENSVHRTRPDFRLGKAICLRDGSDITLICTGGGLAPSMEAAEIKASEGVSVRVLSMHTVKPLDAEAVLAAAVETRALFTVEDHIVSGGLGGAVSEVLAEMDGGGAKLRRIGIADAVSSLTGSMDFLMERNNLSAKRIAEALTFRGP